MQQPPKLPDEDARLQALQRYEILDTLEEQEFDEITELASELCDMPISLITLLDRERQWFKSHHGTDVTQTERSISFCGHAIVGDEIMEVPDTTKDSRFADSPVVIGGPQVRYYAGAPLITSDGFRLGTLCVIDLVPRRLTALQSRALQKLSRVVMRQMENRLTALQHRKSLAFIEKVTTQVPGAIFQLHLGADGWYRMPYVSKGVEALHGLTAASLSRDASGILEGIHPDDRPVLLDTLRLSAAGLTPWRHIWRYQMPGQALRWILTTATPERAADGAVLWHGFNTDVTEQQEAVQALEYQRSFLKMLIDVLPVGVMVRKIARDPAVEPSLITYWNSASERMNNMSAKTVVGRSYAEVFPAARASIFAAHESEVLLNRRMVTVPEYSVPFADGTIHKLRVVSVPLFGADHEIEHMVSIAEDVTDRIELYKHLAESERRLRMITDNLPVAISYIDRDMVYRFTNATMQAWIGDPQGSARGHPVEQVLSKLEFTERIVHLHTALGGKRVEFDKPPNEEQARYMHVTYLPDTDEDGETHGIYTLATDITAIKRHEHSLQQLARFDNLTGLPNRGQLFEILEAALLRCRRTGTALSVLFLDIDHFKSINDTHGHAKGDMVLREFAARLQIAVRATDTVARLAGDEFVILLEGLRSIGDADMVARKILRHIAEPWEVNGDRLGVTTSVGVVCDETHQHSGQDLIALADEMLYASKSAGRNTFRVKVV
ncbi:MAG: diguanylate cyclase domain-containing protein [Janthinobacterium lividum]